MEQWKQFEDLDIKPHTNESLIFEKEAKTTQWKKSIFNTGAGINECHHVEHCNYILVYHHLQNSSPSGSKTST